MAEFRICQLEGTSFVEIHLNEESVRAEAGALSFFVGDVRMHSRLMPNLGGWIKSMLADEAVYRPTYAGSGIVTLESSLGGFHVFDLDGESWILEPGTYLASEGEVDVGYHRERLLPSLLAGEGPLYLQTKVRGYGKVVVSTRGPVEEVVLEENQRVAAEGSHVICRTADVRFRMRRATKNKLGSLTSGEGFVRTYTGPGRILLNRAPYWRYWLFHGRQGDSGDAGWA